MFTQMETTKTSDLHFCSDPDTGLKAIIAIHSTQLGPAIGGCRFISYISEQAAIDDALRLARGMSYKAAMAGLEHGGGKSVIIKPPGDFDRAQLMRAFGRFIEQLGGRYITAMDSGTLTTDMDHIREETRWASCTSSSGDPSPYTAQGVIAGIKAAVKHQYDQDSIEGLRVAIQGLGHVGMAVANHLAMEGVRLTVTDLNTTLMDTAVREYGAKVTAPADIYSTDVDVFCPCGLGAILNPETIPVIRADIIAGSANNQLQSESDGYALAERNILYVPDYVINSGGLVFVALEHAGEDLNTIRHKVHEIGPTLSALFEQAAQEQTPAFVVADTKAEDIMNHRSEGGRLSI